MKLRNAHLIATRVQPYTQAATLSLRPVEAPEVETMAVDAEWRLYWAPAFVEGCSVPELAAVVLHEVWHLLRNHHARAKMLGVGPGQPGTLWNLAGDATINEDLRTHQAVIPLPEGVVYPETFDLPPEGSVEEYYVALRGQKRLPPPPPPPGGPPREPPEGPPVGPPGGPPGGPRGPRGKPPRIEWVPGNDGSGAGPNESEGVKEARKRLGRDLPRGVTPGQEQTIQQRVAEEVRIAHGSRSTGLDLPAGFQRWAEEVLTPPVVPWWERLADLVRGALSRAGQADYSYKRPSRRTAGLGGQVILPSMRRPTPVIAVVVDTSGSVSDRELGLAITEIGGIIQAVDAQVFVLGGDAAAYAPVLAGSEWAAREALVGGGGTDPEAWLAAVAELRPEPHVTVILTDGETGWPAEPPYGVGEVIVGLLRKGGLPPPEWADSVQIE